MISFLGVISKRNIGVMLVMVRRILPFRVGVRPFSKIGFRLDIFMVGISPRVLIMVRVVMMIRNIIPILEMLFIPVKTL